MPNTQVKEVVGVEFIRLFFRSPVEEEVAYRWASRLGRLIGIRVTELRPDTTLSELLRWATEAGVDSTDFLEVFEPELRMEFEDFLDHAEQCTFREMVGHYSKRFQTEA